MIFSLVVFTTFLSIVSALSKPSQDSWYSCPNGYESQPLGTILKWRATPSTLKTAIIPLNVAGAWQLMVRSSDSFGNANCIVTTVIAPHNGDPDKLLSYQTAEDSSCFDCAPSYAIQVGSSLDTIVTSAEMFLISLALERGWYVVTSDYQGFKSAYTAGIQAGHATLDSVRAALKSFSITGVKPSAKVAYWGYSGGAVASGWAAQLQPGYAPDLTNCSLGATVGGYVTNVSAVAHAIDGTVFAGIIPLAVNGLANEYPSLKNFMQNQFTNALQKSRFFNANSFCLPVSITYYFLNRFFTGPLKYFKSGFSVLNSGIPLEVINENTLAFDSNTPVPTMPLMVYQGKLDEIVPYETVVRAYNQYCANGIGSLELNAVSTTGHITELVDGTAAAIAWLEARFAGKPVDVQGCKTTTRLSNIAYPGVNASLVTIIQTAFDTVFGKDIGPNGERLNLLSLIASKGIGSR
ncbi:CIC11C00000000045 [Sungouiella intermedia]|uniref:CIC11C00000000045 n=1 Tax=Sungouiella intermedia TaxID=45354 RepID=A0A1L0D8R6_9ASCO|nr:CIC11C00000000045 [[Candida] intermedia]